MIPVFWHKNDSNWDTAMPRFVLDGAGVGAHYLGLNGTGPVAAFVIPGRHSCKDYITISKAANQFDRVVFVIIGDEESDFEVARLDHDNKIIWWFMPPFNPKQQVDRVAPNGWAKGAPEMIAEVQGRERVLPWSFSGQVTHIRRVECESASRLLPKEGIFIGTQGFTQGLPRDMYYDLMTRSKFALCPSGPCTPDSFRFAEALEAGAVPIVETHTPNPAFPRGYWEYVFSESTLPFPVLETWEALPDMFSKFLREYETMKASCDSWWLLQKENFIARMKEDLDV